MAKRGRTSIDALLVQGSGLAANTPRPDAPYDLADDEVEVWRSVMDSMPADHFIPANYHLLTQLCRHVAEAPRIAQLIKAYRKRKDFNYRDYAALQKMQLDQSLLIARLSCSMRLTQQSNFHQSRRLPGPTINNNLWDEE
jgi:hypothetical protein